MNAVRALALASLLALGACRSTPAPVVTPAPPPVIIERAPLPPPPPKCSTVDPKDLRGQPPAEGRLVHIFAVAKTRREQVDQLSAQLARIQSQLKRGCVELP